MKKVVGDNATLPCHHQFRQSNGQTLDIEWILQKPSFKQRVAVQLCFGVSVGVNKCVPGNIIIWDVIKHRKRRRYPPQRSSSRRELTVCMKNQSSPLVYISPAVGFRFTAKKKDLEREIITFFNNEVYTNDNQASRLSFAGDYLNGDASLLINDLQLSDSGEYHCKVKTGGKYLWTQVNLVVLGHLLEGSDVKLSCKSSDGSDPIYYKWERVLDKGKSVGKLPEFALIDLRNPEIVTLRNLSHESSGVYRCTASNDVGEENCIIEVTMQYVRGVGVVAGAVVGVSFGVLIIILIIWEDAEAPKAKLVKPNSLSSSRSGSSRSGTSSTQSMVHNTAPRIQRPRPPAICALKENGQPPEFLQSSPEPPTPPKFRLPNPPVSLAVPTTGVLMPPQSKAFQTV
ncbi:CXADR-like membrane protein [Bagarius yarrelli]|uniref:CXADR-like membrane protein n=1 Tax=Bagarius yarrelli TaxID=175774 RepID=A0A556TQJ3_BAGYA|nr:CXADR-like membrane protein [Bagarius yarrelli]